MRKLVILSLAVALINVGLAIICRIRFAPIARLSADQYLMVSQTALLFSIVFLLMEKK